MASDRAEQDVRRGVRRDVRRDVRRRDRGQRPTATKNPDTNPSTRRPSRRCSRVRWPRLSHLAVRPHPSRHGYETVFSHPVLRQKTFGETFGAATGVSDPRLQKFRIRNHLRGGQAAAVAGYAGPGFHTWPLGHIPQDTDTKPLLRIRSSAKNRSEKRSAPRPGSATHGYKKSGYKIASSHPVLRQKNVRRNVRSGDRGQRRRGRSFWWRALFFTSIGIAPTGIRRTIRS